MGGIGQQLKQVFRRLRRAPMFTAVTVIPLAAGIGGNTVVFSVLEGVLLKPLPYPRTEELVGVWHNAPGLQITDLNMAPSNYFIYREQGKTLQDIGMYQRDSVSVTGVAEPEQVPAMVVTDGTLPVLGVPPMLGRIFTKEDDMPGTPETVVLTYGYWRHKFGGDPSAVGKTLIVDGKSRQIIGVMPQRFRFLDDDDLAVLTPFQFDRHKVFLGNFSFEALGRLRPGATLEQLNADVARDGLPRVHDIGIDGPVLLFTAAIAVFTSLLFGAIPVFKYAGAQLSTGIREGGRSLSQSREQHRARSVLVVVQVSLALVLLICSGLMIRTFRAMTKVNPGFSRAAELQTFRISIPEAQIKDAEPVTRMEEEILHKVEAVPGVSSVALATAIPMDNSGWHESNFVEGRTYTEGELPPLRAFKFVSPGFLTTMGTSLVAGRDFTWTDTYKQLPVAMVSENIAREYLHDPAAALGKRIRVSTKDDWREIVGVVGNVYYDGVSKPATGAAYWPLLLDNFESDTTRATRDVAVVFRTSRAGSESLIAEARKCGWSVNPNLPLANVHTVEYFYKPSMARTSFTLVMLGVA